MNIERELIYTERLGSSGPHLVMLHGWGQSSLHLKQLGELLSSHCHIHLIDLPGFGKSCAPKTTWSSFEYADFLNEYLKEQGISQCALLGHSFGGKVAMSFAIKYPALLTHLVLIASSGLKRKRSTKEKLRLKAIQYVGKILKRIDGIASSKLFQELFVPKFGSKDYIKAGPLRAILVKSVNEDLSEMVCKIEAPTLLLWGENDSETPIEMGARLHQLIKCSTLFSFPQKGHYLHNDCGAHLCASYILPFLL